PTNGRRFLAAVPRTSAFRALCHAERIGRDSNFDERRVDNRLCQRNADRNRQCEALQSDMKHCKVTWRTGLIFSNIEFTPECVYQIILCGRALPEIKGEQMFGGPEAVRCIAASALIASTILLYPSASKALDNVTLITDFGYNGRHAFAFGALDRGFY